MLTVKHVEENGYESICSAKSISFFPAAPDQVSTIEAFGVGAASVSNDDRNCYQTGIIYVMNEAGKTVGKYDLRRGQPG